MTPVSARLDACRGSSRLYFSHFATRTVDNTVDLYAYEAINSSRIAFFTYHTYIRRPRYGGFPSEYRHPVWHGKTRMAWLPDGEKISKISLFILTQLTNVTDTQTDRHTPHDGIGRAYASHDRIARQKLLPHVATKCQILRLKCTAIDFGWGSAPNPAGGAHSAPADSLAGFKGPYF